MLIMREESNFAAIYKSTMLDFRVKDMPTVLWSEAFSVARACSTANNFKDNKSTRTKFTV